MSQVRIREVFRRIEKHNPISGHSWIEHGPTTAYEVVGPTGVVSRHVTEAAALKAQTEWQAFFDKYPPTPECPNEKPA